MESCLPFEICQNILRNIFRAILRLGRTMPAIKPVSDLRSYNEVLSDVKKEVKSLESRFADSSRTPYEVLQLKIADKKAEFEAGKASGEQSGWLSEESVRALFSL